MKGKLICFLLGALLGILGYYFADDIKKLISSGENWVGYLLLITAVVNTCLIFYILKLTTKRDNERD